LRGGEVDGEPSLVGGERGDRSDAGDHDALEDLVGARPEEIGEAVGRAARSEQHDVDAARLELLQEGVAVSPRGWARLVDGDDIDLTAGGAEALGKDFTGDQGPRDE